MCILESLKIIISLKNKRIVTCNNELSSSINETKQIMTNINNNETPKNWWRQKRLKYNLGLIATGILAYIFIFIIEGHNNFSILAFFVQGIASFIFIGIANLFYFLGPLADKLFNRRNNQLIRERLFNFGFGFSILIPILFSLMFIVFPAWDYGYEPLKNKPSDKELFGVYELNSASKKFLIRQGYNIDSSRLELYSSNTYYFHKLPDYVLNSFGSSNKKTINENGKWNVYCDNGDNSEIVMGGRCYDLGKKDNHLSILITIGDPDSREGIIYEKSSAHLQNINKNQNVTK